MIQQTEQASAQQSGIGSGVFVHNSKHSKKGLFTKLLALVKQNLANSKPSPEGTPTVPVNNQKHGHTLPVRKPEHPAASILVDGSHTGKKQHKPAGNHRIATAEANIIPVDSPILSARPDTTAQPLKNRHISPTMPSKAPKLIARAQPVHENMNETDTAPTPNDKGDDNQPEHRIATSKPGTVQQADIPQHLSDSKKPGTSTPLGRKQAAHADSRSEPESFRQKKSSNAPRIVEAIPKEADAVKPLGRAIASTAPQVTDSHGRSAKSSLSRDNHVFVYPEHREAGRRQRVILDRPPEALKTAFSPLKERLSPAKRAKIGNNPQTGLKYVADRQATTATPGQGEFTAATSQAVSTNGISSVWAESGLQRKTASIRQNMDQSGLGKPFAPAKKALQHASATAQKPHAPQITPQQGDKSPQHAVNNATSISTTSLGRPDADNTGNSDTPVSVRYMPSSPESHILHTQTTNPVPTASLMHNKPVLQQSSGPWSIPAAMQEVGRAAAQGRFHLELKLEPAHLGKIQVFLESDASKQIQVHLVVDQSASRQIIEQQLPHLRQILAQNGLNMGSFSMASHQGQHNDSPAQSKQGDMGHTSTENKKQPQATPPQTSTAANTRLSIRI